MPIRLLEHLPDPALQVEEALAEAEHRFANSLAVVAGLVRSQMRKLPSAPAVPLSEVKALLAETSARIDAVARLHRVLNARPGQPSVKVEEYLSEVVDAVRTAFVDFGAGEILTELEGGAELPVKQVGAIGLLVEEALVNALKHAPGASVAVSLRREPTGRLVTEVVDAGPGPPPDWDPAASSQSGFGLGLMRALAAQLNADLSFDRSGGGLRVRLVLPPPAPPAVA